MLTKIKAYAMAGLAVVATIFYSLWKRSESARAKDKLAAEKKAREVEQLGVEAAFKGYEKEQEIRREEIDTTRRDHFE